MKAKWTPEDKKRVQEMTMRYIKELTEQGFQIRQLKEIKFTHAVNTHGWCMTHANNNYFTLGISCYRFLDGWEAVKETILHELCHAIASHGAGHGKEWRDIAKTVGSIYGVHIERCSSHTIKVAEATKRYVIKCNNCGATGHYMRRTKFVKAVMENDTSTWKCRCGSHHFSMVKGGNKNE